MTVQCNLLGHNNNTIHKDYRFVWHLKGMKKVTYKKKQNITIMFNLIKNPFSFHCPFKNVILINKPVIYKKPKEKQNTKQKLVTIMNTSTTTTLVLLLLLFASPSPLSEAKLECQNEFTYLFPCISYLTGVYDMPTPSCCEAVKALVLFVGARFEDKSKVCSCIKSTTQSLRAKPVKANSLEPKCGVNLCSEVFPTFD